MLRFLYTLLWYAITPLIGLRLAWRARRQPEYLQHLGERFGFYAGKSDKALIWVHAVSVGETRAAQPLIEGLRARWPEHRILLTCMTPTGRDAGTQLYGDAVIQAYLPYDYPGAVDRFFRHFAPEFGVLMETEIWPNLIAGARLRKVPVILANARLSARSAKGYGRFGRLLRPAFSGLRGVAAQTAEDAERLRVLGANPVEICGNLKFDLTLTAGCLELGQAWRAACVGRPVWVAASTREGEEGLVLDAWQGIEGERPLLVLVPRHPQRFGEVAALCASRGLRVVRRSEALPHANADVWLGDSMGEMVAYYAMADLAFIGGSLLPLGGQNLIEAAACGCPVMVGPHTFNFRQATEDSLRAGAAVRVDDSAALAVAVMRLLAEPDTLGKMADAAGRFAAAHRGATGRTLMLIERWMDPAAR